MIFANDCELLKHFDTNNDGIISDDELWVAEELMCNEEITEEEFGVVYNAHNAGSIDAVCPGCYAPTPTPAKGQITTMEFPSIVQHGKPFGIFMQDGIRNTGGSVGIFRLNAYINGTLKWTSGNISISPGNATGPTEIPLTAPSTGTTMTFIIKCIRYT